MYFNGKKILQMVKVGINPTQANASESDVVAGKTFFAGSDTIKTGTLPTYDGPTEITENGTVATSGKVLSSDLTVNVSGGGGGGWQPDADMQWAKSVCENDIQAGYTYKVLQMISDGYVYTNIVVPYGGAVKTSDGAYYTASTKHAWNDTNARQSAVGDYKVRWLIYYYTSEAPTITLLDYVMYACFDSIKFGKIFGSKKVLEYFDIINGADLSENTTNMSSMFSSCSSLQTIPLLNTSNVTNMDSMFRQCSSLRTIPLLNTLNVTNMEYMFRECYSLQTIPSLNASSVTDMSAMFYNCYSLQTISLLNTSNVTSMNSMFGSCSSLQTIPLLDTSSVTGMISMFGSCSSLQTIPLLNTSNVTSMNSMFNSCRSLQTISLLNTSSVTNMSDMFSSCSYLEFLTLTNIGVSLSLSASTKYSRETLVGIINNLVDLTGLTAQTLTIGSTNLAKLTADDIAIATNKNWSVV